MTDNEIIKALEAEIQCCEYFNASRADGVSLEFLKDTLAYINRQKAEIERLNAMVAPVKHGHNDNRNYCGADEFRCSCCGIHLEDWVMYEYDEEFEDEFCYEYEFDYCPNCGARMDGDI